MQSMLRSQLSDAAALKESVTKIHSALLKRGMINPHLRLGSGASMPAILKGDLCDAPFVQVLDDVWSSQMAKKPDGMGKNAWEKKKQETRKEITQVIRELTAMFDDMATAPEVIDKTIELTTQLLPGSGKSVEEARVKAISQLREHWLVKIDENLDKLYDIATRFSSYHDCDERKDLRLQITNTIACAVKARAHISLFDPAPEGKQYGNIVKKMTKVLTSPGKDGTTANADTTATLANLLKSRMEGMLPAALGEEWARFKAGYDFSLIPGTRARESIVSVPDKDRNLLIDTFSILTCIIGGVQYERYDPSSAGAPDVGMAELQSSSEHRETLSTAEKNRQGNIKVSIDTASLARFIDEFSYAGNILGTQINALTTVFAVATGGGAAAVRERGMLADLKQAAGKLAETAEAFESLKLFLQAVTEEAAAGVSGEIKDKVATIIKELEYCEFAAHAAGALGNRLAEYIGGAPDSTADAGAARKAGGRDLSKGVSAVASPAVKAAKPAAKKAELTAEKIELASAPQKTAAAAKPITQGLRDIVNSLHAKAKETRTRAKEVYNEHRIALTDLSASNELARAIAFADEAAATFQEAFDIMKETESPGTGKVSFQELEANLKNCRTLAQLYRSYQESDLSKVPTEETLNAMGHQGMFEAVKPADRSFFQRPGGQSGNMLEVEIRFKDFELESESIKVKPVYLHIHVKEGVDASRLADLTADDIVAAHLKSERQRLYGKAYENRTNREVRRNAVSNKFAIEMARRASVQA